MSLGPVYMDLFIFLYSSGNIYKLIYTPSKGKSTLLTNNRSAYKSEIIINSKTYREVNITITYFLSQTSDSSSHSLVDRGANDSIAGNNV